MQNQSQNQSHTRTEESASVKPSFTISAENKFSVQILRLYADLNLAHSSNDPVEYMEINELATQMEEWRLANPEQCES